MLKQPQFRYLLVGGLCALVHNGIVIGGAALNIHYVITSAISYAVVVVLGFFLHARFTFQVHAGWRSFAKYAAAMLVNYPLWVALMFGLNDMAKLPMLIASPVGTVLMFGWNFAMSHLTIARKAQPLQEP
jgi:putative flippase GtrA